MKKILLVAGFVAAAMPASAVCVNKAGTGGCYSTIQAAVNAAGPNNVVNVSPGTYFENVVIPAGKNGLVLRGLSLDLRARTILDADDPNSGTGITIQSDQVTVKLLRIRNGQSNGIYVDAAGAMITDNVLQSPDSDGIYVTSNGTGTKILRNEIRAVGDEAVYSDADNVTLNSNLIGPCDDGCVTLYGNDVQVIRNLILQSEDDDCLYVDGDRPVIRYNKMRYCDGDGIVTYGENPTITNNEIRSSGGIDADCNSCTGGLVELNDIEGVGDDEGGLDVYADAAGLVVATNIVSNVSDEGAYVSGTGITFRDNIVRGNGGDDYEPGIEIYGDTHTILRNRSIGNVDQGFYVSCNGCTLTANVAQLNFTDGFEINGTSNVLTGNQAVNNAGEGFQVNGTTQTLTKNVGQLNRFDYCETTAGHTLSGNSFPTTGTCAIDN